jgi:hypothetical protein
MKGLWPSEEIMTYFCVKNKKIFEYIYINLIRIFPNNEYKQKGIKVFVN